MSDTEWISVIRNDTECISAISKDEIGWADRLVRVGLLFSIGGLIFLYFDPLVGIGLMLFGMALKLFSLFYRSIDHFSADAMGTVTIMKLLVTILDEVKERKKGASPPE